MRNAHTADFAALQSAMAGLTLPRGLLTRNFMRQRQRAPMVRLWEEDDTLGDPLPRWDPDRLRGYKEPDLRRATLRWQKPQT